LVEENGVICMGLFGLPRQIAGNPTRMIVEKNMVEPCSLPPPEPPVELSEAQLSLYDKVLSHFKGMYALPGYDCGDGTAELSPNEKKWLVCLP
jgi:hypothetical protein